jgi:uncharacterized protein
MKRRDISTGTMKGVFCCSDDGAPRKAVILLSGSRGGFFSARNPVILEKLVVMGYSVLDLAYFRKGRLPHTLRRIPLEYFEKALNWLSEQPEVAPGGYGVLGVSKGAELALLLASRYKEFKAVAAVVPSHVVFQGLGLPFPPASSWTYEGKDVPFVPFAPLPWLISGTIGAFTGRFGYLYRASLKNRDRAEKAEIPVECINGPVLLISATKDGTWPSGMMCEKIISRLSAHDLPHHREHVAIEAPHWVWAKKKCWQSIYGFLETHFPAG